MSFDSWLEPPDYSDTPMEECEDCGGTGKDVEGEECLACEGTGEVEVEFCDFCNSAPCRCDDIYEAWRDERG